MTINRSRKGRGTQAPRPATRHGKPITEASLPNDNYKTPKSVKPYKPYVAPKYPPVSDEVTVYGAKKFRTPYRKDQFFGTAGSRQKAVILDIDGTLQGWGSSADSKVMKWVKEQYDKGYVLIVVTARDEGMQDTSFNWLMHHLPFPFVGPFCRSDDDPRYASEFKRELCEHLEGIYQIMGAADDNKFVNDMWKQWAIDHFADPKDFSLLECNTYSSYSDYRSDLPSKGASYYDKMYGKTSPPKTYPQSYGNSPYSTVGHKGEHWVSAHSDPKTGNWVSGHYEKDLVVPPALPAASVWEKNDTEVTPGCQPIDISYDARWQFYIAESTKAGRYMAPDFTEDTLDPEVIDELLSELNPDTSVRRKDLEQIVAFDYPYLTPMEVGELSDDDLREMSGLTGSIYDAADESEPIYDDYQLSLDGKVDPLERERLLSERLEMETELYAHDLDLTRLQITNLDYEDLVDRLDGYAAEANAKTLFNEDVL